MSAAALHNSRRRDRSVQAAAVGGVVVAEREMGGESPAVFPATPVMGTKTKVTLPAAVPPPPSPFSPTRVPQTQLRPSTPGGRPNFIVDNRGHLKVKRVPGSSFPERPASSGFSFSFTAVGFL